MLELLLILTLLFSLIGCGSDDPQNNQSASIEEDVIEEDVVVKDEISYDEQLPDDIITDNIIYDEGVYECVINDDIICDVVLIDVVVGETTEKDIEAQLPEEYKDYDIDWGKVIGKFAVGTAIIIAVGFIDYATENQAAFFFGTPGSVAKDAIASGVSVAVINTAIQCAIDGKPTKKKIKKYAIEGFADGYMWGAITSVTKNMISKKKLKFANGATAKVRNNGEVLDKAGKSIGKAFYKKGKIYFTDGNDVVKNVFSSSGKELTNVTKALPANSILQVNDFEKTYTDSKGIIYRIGNSLGKGKQYSINGYDYSTDNLGRINSFAAKKLKLKAAGEGRLDIVDSLETIAKGAQKQGDDRGHLIADMFGGDNSLANIVAMNGKLNKGEYKAMELTWQRALQEGKNVTVNGELIFSGNSQRPDKIIVKYIIENGDEVVKTFLN